VNSEKEELMAVITISRQFGAGGRTLGKKIAKELGYTFADSEVVQRIAESINVSPRWVETVEKEAGTTLTKVVSNLVSKSLVQKILGTERGYIDEEIYIDYLVVIISQIAEEGNVVILGRGSQYILSDHPDAWHVLLVNDFESRVQFMIRNYNLGRDKAMDAVLAEEKRRDNLYQKISKSDFDDPELYHMVLNMNKVELDNAQQLITGLLK
jgi:cytidylate kinase